MLRERAQEEEQAAAEAERTAAAYWEVIETVASQHRQALRRADRHRQNAMDAREAARAAQASDRVGRQRPGGF
jgi:hypothetical protein